jgi:hypothetical protein
MGHLSAMSLGELRRRAAAVGVPAQQIEDARDGDDPKSELIGLINAAAAPPPALDTMSVRGLRQHAASAGISDEQIEAARDSEDPRSALIALIPPEQETQKKVTQTELVPLTVRELRQRAADAGITAEVIEDARDNDDPKAALVALLVAHGRPQTTSAPFDAKALQAELTMLPVKELRQRATDAGIDTEAIEDARDNGDPKAALIALITAHSQSQPRKQTKQNAAHVIQVREAGLHIDNVMSDAPLPWRLWIAYILHFAAMVCFGLFVLDADFIDTQSSSARASKKTIPTSTIGISIGPFIHVVLIPVFICRANSHRKEEACRSKRGSGMVETQLDGAATSVIFNIKYTLKQKIFIFFIGNLIDLGTSFIELFEVFGLDLTNFWFPMPFWEFYKAKCLVKNYRIKGAKVRLNASQADAYFRLD